MNESNIDRLRVTMSRRDIIYYLLEAGYRGADPPRSWRWDEFRKPGETEAFFVGNCAPNRGVIRRGSTNAKSRIVNALEWQEWLRWSTWYGR